MGSSQDNVAPLRREPREGSIKAESITTAGALGGDGTANGSELLINTVKVNKPKMLRGLTQQGYARCWGIQFPQPQP